MDMKISILTPSYNSAKYIQRAIESVLLQNYKNWVHIIMDGESKDGTLEVLQAYPHVKYVSEPDRGQTDAMNKAFKLATGDLIIYLNADDELTPGLLDTVSKEFDKDPSIDMIVSDLLINRLGTMEISRPSITLYSILQHQKFKYPLNPGAYAYRKNLQEKIGAFPISNHFTMDYWFLLRAYRIGKIKKVDHVFGTYHVDGSNKSSDTQRSINELRKTRNEFLLEYAYTPKVFFYLFRKLPFIQHIESTVKKYIFKPARA